MLLGISAESKNTMEYDLVRRIPEAEFDMDKAMPYGDMPSSMLTAKFEETDTGDDEHLYVDYSRKTLTDRRPDSGGMASEAGRSSTNNSGHLQLRYNGHRGNADTAAHPEMFLGFDDHDPRGVADEPDMKQMTAQQKARLRYIRFTADSPDQAMSGTRAERKIIADNQTVFRALRSNLKVFSRQIDGRVTGKQARQQNKSSVGGFVARAHGDKMSDNMSLNKRALVICKGVLTDTKEYREEAAEADFAVAKYTQLCRRSVYKDTSRKVEQGVDSHDATLREETTVKHYKAIGLVMSHICRSIKQDQEMQTSSEGANAKTAPLRRDLGIIIRSIVSTTELQASKLTVNGKTATPVERKDHLNSLPNHMTPAHHYINAEILYRSVKPGANLSGLSKQVIGDTKSFNPEHMTTAGKQAKERMVNTLRVVSGEDFKTESAGVFNYRKGVSAKDKRIGNTNGEDFKTESDISQNRRINHQQHRVTGADDQITTIDFSDNTKAERHARGIGSKYTFGMSDRDTTVQSIGDN